MCVIRPQITYGYYVWAKAAELKHNKEKLQKFERIGLKMVTQIRHSTPTDALRVIYNVTPLHLHIKELAMNTYYRVKKYNWIPRKQNLEQSGTQLTLDGRRLSQVGPSTRIGHENYIKRRIPRSLRDVTLDKVAHRFAWNKPYTAEIGSGTIPPELWSYGPFQEEPELAWEPERWHVFTDGSLMEEKSGSGIVVF